MTTTNKSSKAGTPRPDIGAGGRRLADLVDEGVLGHYWVAGG